MSEARIAAEPISSHDEYVVLNVSQVPVSVFHVAPANFAAPSMLAVMASAKVWAVSPPVLMLRHIPRVSAPVALSGYAHQISPSAVGRSQPCARRRLGQSSVLPNVVSSSLDTTSTRAPSNL